MKNDKAKNVSSVVVVFFVVCFCNYLINWQVGDAAVWDNRLNRTGYRHYKNYLQRRENKITQKHIVLH